jgi:hypothetical protein
MIELEDYKVRADWATARMALKTRPAVNVEWATALFRWSFFARRPDVGRRIYRNPFPDHGLQPVGLGAIFSGAKPGVGVYYILG